MRATYEVSMLFECTSPLTHMMGTSGNEAIINRERIYSERGIVAVPVISGNALRHRMVREPGMLHLFGAEELTMEELHFAFTGGTLTESSVSENWKRIQEMEEVWPLASLLGGCLRNQITEGRLEMGRGLMVCEENRERLEHITQESIPRLIGADAFVGSYQYTRGDSSRNSVTRNIAKDSEGNGKSESLMIFSGESIVPHALFFAKTILRNVNELEAGAFFHSIELWEQSPTIGGQKSRGHGRMNLWVSSECDMTKLSVDYAEHADSHRKEIREWLSKAFEEKKKEKKSVKR